MAALSVVYEDVRLAKEKIDTLWNDHAYDANGDLSKAHELAKDATELLDRVTADFAALADALDSTRG